MKQEQKPFEIKEVIEASICNLELTELYRICLQAPGDFDYCNRTVGRVTELAMDANAEIRRLQAIVADAPSWGEWKDATVKNLVAVSIGIYEFETNDGVTFLASKRHDNVSSSSWVLMDGQLRNACDFELNPRFRRLNYTPKTAREASPPEKTYDYGGKKFTASDMASQVCWSDAVQELARDLLAVQAELRELKGKR